MPIALDDLAIVSIRQATRERHSALEEVMQLGAPLSRSRYLDALHGFDLFLSMWEPQIVAALPQALRPWFTSASRRGLLQDDFTRLGHPQGTAGHVQRACQQALSGIELGGGGVFGSIYVLEGSALGGQVIAKLAAATLGLQRNNGTAYFSGHAGSTAARWAAFRSLLEEQVGTQPLARQQACSAACQTFDALIVTFTHLCRDAAAA